MAGFFKVREGVRVAADGAWSVGGLPIRHLPSLRLLKARLRFGDDGAFLMDGPVRLPVRVEGPAFEVERIRLDAVSGMVQAILDDGSEEALADLGMDADTGRFVCLVRAGRARAILSRAAHHALLEHVEQENGSFYVAVGPRRLPLRT